MKRLFKVLLATIFFTILLLSASAKTLFIKKDQYISYADKGHGKVLVLIHAFPTDKRLWQSSLTMLSKKFRVITLDLWGFGQSSAVNGAAISMNDYANEIKVLLDHLHINKVIIGGESMGGYIALSFYANYKKMTQGLVLSNTQAIADTNEMRQIREKTAQTVLKEGTVSVINAFMAKALTQNASAKVRAALFAILNSQSPNALASALRGMSIREDTSDLLAKTNLPVLIITSTEDQVISPEQSLAMHKLCKTSTLVTLDHAAHLSNLEQTNAWNKAIINEFAKDNKTN